MNVTLSHFITHGEDPNEMQHNAAFHQGLHCKGKKDLQAKEYNIFFKNIPHTPRYVQWNVLCLSH